MLISAVVFRGTFGVKSAINDTSVFKNVLQKCILRRFTSFRVWSRNSRSFCSSSQRLISVSRFSKAVETLEKNYQDAKNILNNVILFKFERATAFKVVIAFAVIQLFGMFSMANNVYNTFCQDLFKPDKNWKTRIFEHKYSLFAIFSACIFGPTICILTYVIASRTVRRIILHKGGQRVTIVTYHPIPSWNTFTTELKHLSCRASRTHRSTLPLRIKDRMFFYFVDCDGVFPNSELFDFTVGIKREFD